MCTTAAGFARHCRRPGFVRRGRNRRWRDENREALGAYAREVARSGLPLARFRSF